MRAHPKADSGWLFASFLPFFHRAATVFLSAIVTKDMYFSIRMRFSLLSAWSWWMLQQWKPLPWSGWRGRALSERVLWLLLIVSKKSAGIWKRNCDRLQLLMSSPWNCTAAAAAATVTLITFRGSVLLELSPNFGRCLVSPVAVGKSSGIASQVLPSAGAYWELSPLNFKQCHYRYTSRELCNHVGYNTVTVL